MPKPPSTAMLVTSIRQVDTLDEQAKQKQIAAVYSSAETTAIKQWWKALLPQLDPVANDELREWISLAFLGACVGFAERNLHPNHPEHHYRAHSHFPGQVSKRER